MHRVVRFICREIQGYIGAGLPLLTKEMIEQSSRKRTFVIRVLYLSALCIGAGLIFLEETWQAFRYNPMAILGMGRSLLQGVMGCQFMGIFIFVPLLASGLITSEKERDSLSLLLLTRMRPGSIVLEKLLGRLVPMCYFFFAALPGFALAYSLGGVTPSLLASGVWMLCVTAFQCCAVALLCSTWCRTTVSAFFTTLIVSFLLIVGMPLLEGMDILDIGRVTIASVSAEPAGMMAGPYIYFDISERAGFLATCFLSVPMIMSGIACVVAARFALIPRAFVPKRNLLLNAFAATDRFLRGQLPKAISSRFLRDTSSLPQDRPIHWRETTKSITGSTRYQLYLFALIEIPLVLMCFAIYADDDWRNPNYYPWRTLEQFALLQFMWWFVATLVVAVKSASLFSLERSHQTFDILMTTPMTTRDVLRQKMSSVTQLIRLLLLMFVTLVVFETVWRDLAVTRPSRRGWNPFEGYDTTAYVLCHVVTALIYLPMIGWLSVALGLRIRSHIKAIFTTVLVIVAWCIVPFMLLAPFFITRVLDPGDGEWLLQLSPATIIPLNEFNELGRNGKQLGMWWRIIGNAVFYGLIYLGLRTWCLWSSDNAVGRMTGPVTPVSSPAQCDVGGSDRRSE